MIADGAKMSKSRATWSSAERWSTSYGADTGRLFALFAAPPEKDMDWIDAGVEGTYRFLEPRLPLRDPQSRACGRAAGDGAAETKLCANCTR